MIGVVESSLLASGSDQGSDLLVDLCAKRMEGTPCRVLLHRRIVAPGRHPLQVIRQLGRIPCPVPDELPVPAHGLPNVISTHPPSSRLGR